MPKRLQSIVYWATRFFYIMLCHDSLGNLYNTNFALMQHHKYSLTELENMIPWEREVYVNMVVKFIKDENERLKQQQLQTSR